ncbi:hypothetical protein VUR80DRAFT_9287 [Thermomyces stellatus]
MTTAHRPTFDPARGREALRGPAYHQITLPAHLELKYRKAGQGGTAGTKRDLRAELLEAEAAHFAKKGDATHATGERSTSPEDHHKRERGGEDEEEDPEAKRRRILAETRDIDADDSDESDESDSDSDSDSDAELQRELERVRREKAERREREERERARREEEERERDIARGNPLLNKVDYSVKRRWDDDVVFRNQARDVDERGKKKEFVNDMLRSDFHRRFMDKYVK